MSEERQDVSQFELFIERLTSHMIKDKEISGNVSEKKVSCAKGTVSVVEGTGKMEFFAENSKETLQKVVVENALNVFQNSKKLISIKGLNATEARVVFDEKPRIEIEHDCSSSECRNNLFFLRTTKFEVFNTAEVTLQLWHERLGHNNKKDIRKYHNRLKIF